ncbi:MAG: flagellin, partial [Hyphomonadaceae bacterium]|nr:flagellin [Hyphomonadaceae bacterium]
MVKPIPSFLVATLARNDLARLNNDLYDLQRQTASGVIAQDLKGYGQEAGRIVSARAAIAQSEGRVAAANRLAARLDIQDAALGKAGDAAAQLKQDIFEALASNDATYLAGRLEVAFGAATQAFNTTHEGVHVFAGERRGGPPVQADTLDELGAAIDTGALFSESTRTTAIDIGVGAPIAVAEKASDFATHLYNVFRDLHAFTSDPAVGAPLTDAQRATLTAIVGTLDVAYGKVVDAQGRNGDTQARLEGAVTRLTAQADLLTKHLGKVSEADLAEVAMRLSATKTQYEAAASVFAQIRDLSLVNFLD